MPERLKSTSLDVAVGRYKKISLCGEEEIICIANNSLEVCLIGLAPSENAIARKFATVWVDAKKKFATKVERTGCETTLRRGLVD